VETKDFYDDLAANPKLMRFMDTSNLPSDHKCYSTVGKRIPGLFNNVTDSRTVYEFVALRAKSYAYDVEHKVTIRAMGKMIAVDCAGKAVMRIHRNASTYSSPPPVHPSHSYSYMLFTPYRENTSIRSFKHQTCTTY